MNEREPMPHATEGSPEHRSHDELVKEGKERASKLLIEALIRVAERIAQNGVQIEVSGGVVRQAATPRDIEIGTYQLRAREVDACMKKLAESGDHYAVKSLVPIHEYLEILGKLKAVEADIAEDDMARAKRMLRSEG